MPCPHPRCPPARRPARSAGLLALLLVGCSSAAAPTAAATERLHLPGAPPIELVPIAAHGDVAAFWIARTELTNAQFAAFVRATGYDGSDHPSSKGSEPFLRDWRDGAPPPGRDEHPVCYLNVHHARAFCAWASATSGRRVRLPSDAEWELAARGREQRAFPWGDEWDPARCNHGGDGDGFAEAAPVGSFPRGATPDGVLDLAGNIWEWTAEAHLRGGPWCMGPDTVRSDVVAHEDPERADDKFGMRIVVER